MDMMIVGDGGPRKKRDRTSYLAFRHQFRHSPDQGPEERLYGGAWTLYWDSILGTPDLAWKRKPISLIAISVRVLQAQLSSSAVDITPKLHDNSCRQGYGHLEPGLFWVHQRRKRGCYPVTLCLEESSKARWKQFHAAATTCPARHTSAQREIADNGKLCFRKWIEGRGIPASGPKSPGSGHDTAGTIALVYSGLANTSSLNTGSSRRHEKINAPVSQVETPGRCCPHLFRGTSRHQPTIFVHYGDSCPANWGRPRFWAQQWKAAALTGERGQEEEDEGLCSMPRALACNSRQRTPSFSASLKLCVDLQPLDLVRWTINNGSGKLASSTLLTITYPLLQDAEQTKTPMKHWERKAIEVMNCGSHPERQLNSLVLLQQPQRGFCEQGQRNDGQRPGFLNPCQRRKKDFFHSSQPRLLHLSARVYNFTDTTDASGDGPTLRPGLWIFVVYVHTYPAHAGPVRWFVSIAHLSLLIKDSKVHYNKHVSPPILPVYSPGADVSVEWANPGCGNACRDATQPSLLRSKMHRQVTRRAQVGLALHRLSRFVWVSVRLTTSTPLKRGSLNQPLARNKGDLEPYTGRLSKQAAAVLRVALFRRHGTYPIDATLVYSHRRNHVSADRAVRPLRGASPQSHTAAASTSTRSGREAPSQCAAAAAAGNRNGNGFFPFEQPKADDAGATGVDIRREGHSAALVLLSFIHRLTKADDEVVLSARPCYSDPRRSDAGSLGRDKLRVRQEAYPRPTSVCPTIGSQGKLQRNIQDDP
ncbi:uncharacterized protein CLUP02_15129 [Colletotrichum lupini]|uniref:Uncharacterized protein n=1 Tax=Colletotrichum lupini TaxID=145971 RepID=A0A9Q8T644_9PEZI|nr:uncharacterized protein CLUP02_15129 [Colletotrichum lupini]UQC89598.1 hypothetical protein CLUP02_15129 [Colletotrichum lupini]